VLHEAGNAAAIGLGLDDTGPQPGSANIDAYLLVHQLGSSVRPFDKGKSRKRTLRIATGSDSPDVEWGAVHRFTSNVYRDGDSVAEGRQPARRRV
jgi:hypothetical protein